MIVIRFLGAISVCWCCTQSPAVASERHHYDHNGSIVLLVKEQDVFKITYEKPSRRMSNNGVHPGTVLFIGKQDQEILAGKASLFSNTCGEASYNVSGGWDRGRSFALMGDAAPRDASCKFGLKKESVLLFDYIPSAPRKATNTKYGRVQLNMLDDPLAALKMLRSSYVPNRLEIEEMVASSRDLRIGRGIDASFCLDDLVLADYSPKDRFIGYFEYMVAYQAKLGRTLEIMGYPREVWSRYLDAAGERYVERLYELLENGADYDYGTPKASVKAELKRLVDALEHYRRKSGRRLIEVTATDFCGGDRYDPFEVKADASGSVSLRNMLDEAYCSQTGHSTSDQECGQWMEALPGTIFPAGRYRYRATWPDPRPGGVQRTGVFEGSGSPVVISKPGG